MGYLSGLGQIVAHVIIGLVLLVLVLRVLLPLSRASFSNPICQLVYRLTNPVMRPLSMGLPTWRRFTIAGAVLAWVVASLLVWVYLLIGGFRPGLLDVLLIGFGTLVYFVLALYFFCIVIVAVMSFFSPNRNNPAVEILTTLTAPVLRLFRPLSPRNVGFDLSPLWACLSISLINYTLHYVGLPGLRFL